MPKISGLPPVITPEPEDELAVVDKSGNITRRMSLTQIKEWLQALVGWVTTAMLGDAAVTGPKMGAPIGFSAAGGTQNFSTGSPTKVTGWVEEYDPDGMLTAGTFTADRDGIYSLGALVQINNTGTGRIIMWIYKNGVTYTRSEMSGNSAAHDCSVSASYDLKLDENDTLEIYAFQESGSTQAFGSGHFSCTLKGAI